MSHLATRSKKNKVTMEITISTSPNFPKKKQVKNKLSTSPNFPIPKLLWPDVVDF